MAFMVATPLIPLLFNLVSVVLVSIVLTAIMVAAFKWAASAAVSLLQGIAFRAWCVRRNIFFIVCAAILLGFFSTPPSLESSPWSELAPSPERVAFVAHRQLQPSPCMTYGGEADEAIRFMEMECMECGLREPMPETAFEDGALSEAAEQWLLQLEEEVRLIEELPFVQKGTLVFRESEQSANLNKVEVAVWCCWSGSQFKRPVASCDEKEKPTHLEAARALRLDLIEKHGQQGHPTHPRAANRRTALVEAGEVEPATAFDRLRVAGMAQRRTQAQVTEDEKAVAEARTAEQRAAERREAAEAKLKASKEKVNIPRPHTHSHQPSTLPLPPSSHKPIGCRFQSTFSIAQKAEDSIWRIDFSMRSTHACTHVPLPAPTCDWSDGCGTPSGPRLFQHCSAPCATTRPPHVPPPAPSACTYHIWAGGTHG